MIFSYNWLGELVEGLDTPPAELAALITRKTAEAEGVHAYAPHLAGVRAARVESVEPLEGSKNVKAVVDVGALGRKTVVCGAPNCRPGIVTAYVAAGTRLGSREIGRAMIGGVESEGMLASGAELGINRDHTGILELDAVGPGAPLGLAPDWLIEIDNKSLTHRPDLWGHYGMAREVAAIAGKTLRDPVQPNLIPGGAPEIAVRVEDFSLCPRYSALVFENVTVQPSPLWLQYRLEAIGLNPINNIVDVTNFVMAELAQPMHAFDADKLRGGIVVRTAREGETIAALNGETYKLSSSNLVIADQAGAVAVAGVIGGADSAIGAATRRIVFESANFHASSVRKTSAALKLRTDASMRFEKAQDPANTVRGLARAVELLRTVSPGIRIVGGLADAAQPPRSPAPIELPLAWMERKLGRSVPAAEVRDILQSLSFGVEENTPGVLTVSVPSWRATKDISIKEDLVEEVGRMIGYEAIAPAPPLVPTTVPPSNELRVSLNGFRRLIAAQGYTEVYNYSFLSDELARQFQLDPADHVRVLNPIASDQALLRTTLIPNIWRNIQENVKYSDEFRLFEIGREIHRRDAGLPNEANHVVLVCYLKDGGTSGLFELKRVAECLSSELRFRPSADPRPYEHPARVAEALLDGQWVGRLFEFHPSYVRGRAAVLDIDLDVLLRLSRRDRAYQPIRRFPSSAFDLSVIAPARALVGDIEDHLRRLAGEGLEAIAFVREYSGPPLEPGTKSVSFRLTVAAPGRTLSSDEVAAVRSGVIEGMRSLGFDLRV